MPPLNLTSGTWLGLHTRSVPSEYFTLRKSSGHTRSSVEKHPCARCWVEGTHAGCRQVLWGRCAQLVQIPSSPSDYMIQSTKISLKPFNGGKESEFTYQRKTLQGPILCIVYFMPFLMSHRTLRPLTSRLVTPRHPSQVFVLPFETTSRPPYSCPLPNMRKVPQSISFWGRL